MTEAEFKARTKQFAVAIVKFAKTLPNDPVTVVMVRQLVKSGSSVGANYRAACRGKSEADFIAKLAIVEEEGDEAMFWLEVLVEAGIVNRRSIAALWDEADQIVRITVASIVTVRRKLQRSQSRI